MRVRLVLNRRSRRGATLGTTVAQALRACGIEVLERREKTRPDAIVVAGGDGTFVRAIPAAMELDVPMGLVPLGTFNDLARTLEIPTDVAAACALIAAGATRTIDVARVNGVYYVNEASIGASSRITRLQRTSEKQHFGWLAIVASAIRGLRYVRPFRATIQWNGSGDSMKTIQLTIANSQRFGGFISVADAAIDDGQLDCYAIEARGLFPVVALVAAVIQHGPSGLPGLRAYRSSAIRIVTPRPHRIAADGEPAGSTPALFEIVPRALKVFSPPC